MSCQWRGGGGICQWQCFRMKAVLPLGKVSCWIRKASSSTNTIVSVSHCVFIQPQNSRPKENVIRINGNTFSLSPDKVCLSKMEQCGAFKGLMLAIVYTALESLLSNKRMLWITYCYTLYMYMVLMKYADHSQSDCSDWVLRWVNDPCPRPVQLWKPYWEQMRMKILMKTIRNNTGVFTVSRFHDDDIKWKHFPRYWPFVGGIHQSPVSSPHRGQWRGALIFSLICAWINRWVTNS